MSLKWYAPGTNVGMFVTKVKGGMIYTSAARLQWPGEPSAIDLSAKVAFIAANPAEDLGYWPSFGTMNPSQRKSYLGWLADGRRDANPQERSLGYLFTFFYGLERRIILDQDRDPRLLHELLGLLEHYGSAHTSRSLRSYFLSLLYFGSWQQGPRVFRSLWPRLIEFEGGTPAKSPSSSSWQTFINSVNEWIGRSLIVSLCRMQTRSEVP